MVSKVDRVKAVVSCTVTVGGASASDHNPVAAADVVDNLPGAGLFQDVVGSGLDDISIVGVLPED